MRLQSLLIITAGMSIGPLILLASGIGGDFAAGQVVSVAILWALIAMAKTLETK